MVAVRDLFSVERCIMTVESFSSAAHYIATAFTIRSLHSIGGEIAARKKAMMLGWSFVTAFCFKVVSTFAPGIMWDWHIGWTCALQHPLITLWRLLDYCTRLPVYRLGFMSIIHLDNWGWWIEFTPAFCGAGMLSGMNASWSFLAGAVLAWGIIGPATVSTGLTQGIDLGEDNRWAYTALHFDDIEEGTPSPRYWLLWPGVLMCVSFPRERPWLECAEHTDELVQHGCLLVC